MSDTCRAPDEREVLSHAFTLLAAFDEVISLGYRENVNLMQVRNVLEMDSHEEKIQDIIARNKEAEAKEELKRRAKQLEIQRREQQRGGGGASFFPAPSVASIILPGSSRPRPLLRFALVVDVQLFALKPRRASRPAYLPHSPSCIRLPHVSSGCAPPPLSSLITRRPSSSLAS